MMSSSGTNRCGPTLTRRGRIGGTLTRANMLGSGERVAHHDGEVERETRDVGERVRRVHRERRQHREDLLQEHRGQPLLLLVGGCLPPQHLDPFGTQRGAHLGVEDLGAAQHQLVAACPDAIEHLARHQAAGGPHRDAGGDPPLEAGDPHHEELVEVAREDRQELGALEQRQLAVLGELEDALVEGEPGQLAVQEPVVGQRLLDARQDGGGVVGRGSYLRDLGVLAHAHRLRIARPGGSRSAFNTCMPVGGRACRDHASPPVGGRACRGPRRRSSLSRPVRSRTAPPPEAPAPLVVSTSSTTGLGTQRRPSGRACRGPGRRSSLSRPVTSRRSSRPSPTPVEPVETRHLTPVERVETRHPTLCGRAPAAGGPLLHSGLGAPRSRFGTGCRCRRLSCD